jgi:hypothetical protein
MSGTREKIGKQTQKSSVTFFEPSATIKKTTIMA